MDMLFMVCVDMIALPSGEFARRGDRLPLKSFGRSATRLLLSEAIIPDGDDAEDADATTTAANQQGASKAPPIPYDIGDLVRTRCELEPNGHSAVIPNGVIGTVRKCDRLLNDVGLFEVEMEFRVEVDERVESSLLSIVAEPVVLAKYFEPVSIEEAEALAEAGAEANASFPDDSASSEPEQTPEAPQTTKEPAKRPANAKKVKK